MRERSAKIAVAHYEQTMLHWRQGYDSLVRGWYFVYNVTFWVLHFVLLCLDRPTDVYNSAWNPRLLTDAGDIRFSYAHLK